jgi:hypothetical protein
MITSAQVKEISKYQTNFVTYPNFETFLTRLIVDAATMGCTSATMFSDEMPCLIDFPSVEEVRSLLDTGFSIEIYSSDYYDCITITW